jgi:hypothetical protein
MQAIDFSSYRFRCSALGKLISKSGQFTDSNKTYVRDVHVGAVYNIQKEITSKYFEKGIMCEMDGVDFIKKVYHPNDYVPKNKERFSNDFIDGEPDVLMPNDGHEIKNAYDRFTFGKADLTHEYLWQCKGYLWLTGKPLWHLWYVLSDMPDTLLGNEEKNLYYSGKFTDTNSTEWIEAQIALHKKYDYSGMQMVERFKHWEIRLSDLDIASMEHAVKKGRQYMQDIELERMGHIENNLKMLTKSRK